MDTSLLTPDTQPSDLEHPRNKRNECWWFKMAEEAVREIPVPLSHAFLSEHEGF